MGKSSWVWNQDNDNDWYSIYLNKIYSLFKKTITSKNGNIKNSLEKNILIKLSQH